MHDHVWWRKISNRLLIAAGVWGVLMITMGVFLLRFAWLRPALVVLFALYVVFFFVSYGVYLNARRLERRAMRRPDFGPEFER
ncbi:hypothetical protein [Bifidobacterium avesanii]|uniref:Uncharacterized protein n=1 Tax=Bifidobacterium avesanii TaxID=1798157 RepID=A0A7K3THC1_9BIFI|nr:hypothetical protein [Bifidobacterium avesanii]KAB8292675.1 hypothetical protein DSM100685_0964 [Bifidobacterium avesanii]NEG78497.1 hypothetical protein [Bifidobacterium avesanii]